ncbi:MAG: DUF3090 family protein [Actinomycetota bacterium]
MSRSFDLDPALRFTAGAVGEPGARVFLIQARSDDQYLTLLCEKEQVAILARELGRVLAMLPETETPAPEPEPIDLELIEPLEPDWRVGSMSIEYDPERDLLIVMLREFVPGDPDDDEPEGAELEIQDDEASARIVVTRAQVRAMVEHALEVVGKGRPRCEICSMPMEPDEDHHCPGMNGHRPRQPDDEE